MPLRKLLLTAMPVPILNVDGYAATIETRQDVMSVTVMNSLARVGILDLNMEINLEMILRSL